MPGCVHERAADGSEATEIDVQLIGVHQTRQIATKDLAQHAEQHQTTRTDAESGKFSDDFEIHGRVRRRLTVGVPGMRVDRQLVRRAHEKIG